MTLEINMNNKSHFIASVFLTVAVTASAAPPSWPQFRGPNGAGVAASGERPPAVFGPTTNLLWKIESPSGASSPCIWGDKIFLTGFADDKLEVLCLRRADGAMLWRKPVKVEKLEAFMPRLGSPAASTCATDGKRVVSYFGSFGLLCHDFDGKELWNAPLPLPKQKEDFGSGTSPIIHNGLVYLLRDEDGPGAGLYAFDLRNGKQVWRASRKDFRVSFGSPVVWDGCVVVIGDVRVKGYDLKTGAERWVVRGIAAYPCTSPTVGADGNLYVATWSPNSSNERNMPTFDDLLGKFDKDKDGKLSREELSGGGFKDFFDVNDKNHDGFWESEEWMAGYNFMLRGKNAVLAIKPGGKGDISDTHVVWTQERGAPYVSSPLAYDGRVFMVKDGGLASCYEAKTGKVLFEKERLNAEGNYYASPVVADGKIFIGSDRGMLVVLSATDKLEILATNDLGESLSATPAIVENKLYIRTAQHLWAFGAQK